jgi:hypothetical protein
MNNAQYVSERNKLIPIAEKYADKVAGKKPRSNGDTLETWNNKWNLAFHTQMNILAKNAGLVS